MVEIGREGVVVNKPWTGGEYGVCPFLHFKLTMVRKSPDCMKRHLALPAAFQDGASVHPPGRQQFKVGWEASSALINQGYHLHRVV